MTEKRGMMEKIGENIDEEVGYKNNLEQKTNRDGYRDNDNCPGDPLRLLVWLGVGQLYG